MPRTVPRTGGDIETLQRAIDQTTDGNVPAFGALVGLHHTQLYRRLRGEQPVPEWLGRLARLLIAHPSVARWLEAARE